MKLIIENVGWYQRRPLAGKDCFNKKKNMKQNIGITCIKKEKNCLLENIIVFQRGDSLQLPLWNGPYQKGFNV